MGSDSTQGQIPGIHKVIKVGDGLMDRGWESQAQALPSAFPLPGTWHLILVAPAWRPFRLAEALLLGPHRPLI